MRLVLLFALGLLVFVAIITHSRGDDSPGFFLKITKNVPRLGRRSGDSYFLKNMKTIPRIGRRDASVETLESADMPTWLTDTAATAQHKRMLLHPAIAAAAAEREYSVVQPVNSNTLIELLDRNAISSDNIKFVHWKDFDRALQLDTELYTKVISLGRKPDQRLKEDLSYGFGNNVPAPLLNNANNYLLYNKDNGDVYADKYAGDFLHYNQLD